MDASSGRPGGLSLLKKYVQPGEYCLDFYYMMYGKSVDQLRVYTAIDKGKSEELWKVQGNKLENWINEKLSVKITKPKTVCAHKKLKLKDRTFYYA